MSGDDELEEVEAEAPHLLIGSVLVREYMESATGERAYTVESDGDLPISNILGLLRLAEHWVISEMEDD